MKILVATEKPFAPVAVNGIKAELDNAGHELVLLEKYTEKQQLLDAVANADALIVRSDKITPEVLDAAKELKIVVRAGAGYDNIDTAYAKKRVLLLKILQDKTQTQLLSWYLVYWFTLSETSTTARLVQS